MDLPQWLEQKAQLSGNKLTVALKMCAAALVENLADLKSVMARGGLDKVFPQGLLLVHVQAALEQDDHAGQNMSPAHTRLLRHAQHLESPFKAAATPTTGVAANSTAAVGEAPILAGITVLDLTTAVAGPAAGALLADFGANVIKVEEPGGDSARYTQLKFYQTELKQESRTMAPTFEMDNRGKRSIALDLKTEEGKRVFKILMSKADVFVTNVRVGGLQRLGLDYESIRDEFPQLVYAHLSCWGLNGGPDAMKPGYDLAGR